MNETSMYKNSNTNTLGLLLLLSLGIIGTCLYLTSYYFETKYSSGLTGNVVCDINSFFNCNTTTYSKASNFLGVPVSLFGLLIGILALAGFLFNSPRYERTLYAVLSLNLAGCLLLLIYSLAFLGSLCPFCTLYYILSFFLFLLFHKKVPQKGIDPKCLSFMALSFLIVFVPYLRLCVPKRKRC